MSGGGAVDHELAAGREHSTADQPGVRGADGAPDNSEINPAAAERVELRVIAGPSRFKPSLATSKQTAHNVAVRVEDADVRDAGASNLPLPACFAEQILRRKCRRLRVMFLRKDRRDP